MNRSRPRFSRIAYLRRIFKNYVLKEHSHLAFWHERVAVEERAKPRDLAYYYMTFRDKADYPGPFDADGVPKLDYGGVVGMHHNPIAIAQYGLARYNRYLDTTERAHLEAAIAQARWLVKNLKPNDAGVPVWTHGFDWEYREGVRAPWASALAQGQALSLLVRIWKATGDGMFLDAARSAFAAFEREIDDGGLSIFEEDGVVWVEEIIVDPPSHILNGYMWAYWGLHDLAVATGEPRFEAFRARCEDSLKRVLPRFDVGFWSLYEISPYRIPMLASPFYHGLHIVQLDVMHRLTGDPLFKTFHDRWKAYAASPLKRRRAFATKVLFKLLHY